MRRGATLAILLAAAASGCASSGKPTAEQEFKFGAKMALHGNWREARFRFDQVLKVEPKNARAYNNLAIALEAMGEYTAAFENYKKAVELAPGDKDIHQNYSRFAEFYTVYSKSIGKAVQP